MGVHDFCCFVQRNGQNLHGFEPLARGTPDSKSDLHDVSQREGAADAVIAIVPDGVDVEALELPEFAKYPVLETSYSWDAWQFTELEDEEYFEVLGDYDHIGVWKHTTYPGKQLVNFERNTYLAFVKGQIPPKRVPYAFYGLLLEARDINTRVTDKVALHRLICHPITKPLETLGDDYLTFAGNEFTDLFVVALIAQYAAPERSEDHVVACVERGDLDMLRWLKRWRILDDVTPKVKRAMLMAIEKDPKGEMLRFLRMEWAFDPADRKLSAACGEVFRRMCYTSSVGALAELRSGWGMTVAMTVPHLRAALGSAASMEELRTWGVTPQQMRAASTGEFITNICRGPTPKDLNYLREKWGFSRKEVAVDDNVALRGSCFEGRMDTLKELRKFGLDASDARAKNNEALIKAARNGHAGILRELRTTWGLTLADARTSIIAKGEVGAGLPCAEYWARENRHESCVEELRKFPAVGVNGGKNPIAAVDNKDVDPPAIVDDGKGDEDEKDEDEDDEDDEDESDAGEDDADEGDEDEDDEEDEGDDEGDERDAEEEETREEVAPVVEEAEAKEENVIDGALVADPNNPGHVKCLSCRVTILERSIERHVMSKKRKSVRNRSTRAN